MTDNEIIIDGVDIYKCKHYKNKSCIADYLLTDQDFSKAKCAYSSDCYFKQLARKTAECERYKQVLDEIEQYCNEQNLKYDTTACEILDIISKAKDGNNE